MKYRFGDFSLDLRRGTLEGAAGVVHLRPQAFKLLEVLVTRAPEIIGHEELLDLVWGTRHLSPSSLKQTISEVRHTLGDAVIKCAVGRRRKTRRRPENDNSAYGERHAEDDPRISSTARTVHDACVRGKRPKSFERCSAAITSHAGKPTTFEYEPSMRETANAPIPWIA